MAPSPSDDQPSQQVAMAAWMLRNGDDPNRVAAVTDVPFALVELIAEHLPPPATGPRRPGLPPDQAPAAGDSRTARAPPIPAGTPPLSGPTLSSPGDGGSCAAR